MVKIVLIIFTIYLISVILNTQYFMVPDTSREKVICNAIEDGYIYDNLVVDKKGVNANSPDVECWMMCTYTNCEIVLEQPMTEGWQARFLIATIIGLLFFILFEVDI